MENEKNPEMERKKIVKSSQRWEDFRFMVKWGIIALIGYRVLDALYDVYGPYIYYSFALSFLAGFFIFSNTIDVPSEDFIESRIEWEKDIKGKDKPIEFVINEYEIPEKMIKSYEIKGDRIVKFKKNNGRTVNIVHKIDKENKIIYFTWFSGVSHWEFLIDAKTFVIMEDLLKEAQTDLLINKKTREIWYRITLVKMYENQYKDKEKYEDYLESQYKLLEQYYGESQKRIA
jgi:hypothetical protein